MNRDALLTVAYRRLARSKRAVAFATRLRGVAAGLLSHRMADGVDFETNGEGWLAELAAPRASVVVDVGANRGEWAAMFLPQPGLELALLFEPSAWGHRELTARFGGDPRVQIVNAAAADEPGEMPFYEVDAGGTTSSLAPGLDLGPGSTRTVAVTTLDEELRRLEVDHVDFCKIDAEGYDLRVMRGARSLLSEQRVDLVQFEYSMFWRNAGSTLADAFLMLEGYGYEVFLLKHQALYRFDYDRYGELFTYSNFVAVAPRARDLVTPFLAGDI